MRCGSGLLNCHSYFVQGVSVLLDSSNRRLHVSLSPQLILFSTCPRRYSPEFRGPWICQQPEVDRRGCRLEHEHDFFSHTSLPTITFLLSWQCWEYVLSSGGKLKKDKQRAETVTHGVWSSQQAAVRFALSLKSWDFWNRWCLEESTDLYHPKNKNNSFAKKPSANLQNRMFA